LNVPASQRVACSRARKRPRLAAIFTVPQAGAKDLEAVSSALSKYDRDIEYIEAAPTRSLKG
jgi:hypothetical protein